MDLLERQFQLGELKRLLREAGAGAGKIALVSGEAGAGKSALVEEFAKAAGKDARVLWGHSDALQTSRVLGPVNELALGLSPRKGVSADLGLNREQLFSRLLEQLAAPNPLSLVVLEDLHWADEATLDFVRFLGRRIQRTRCLLIATYRDDEQAPPHLLRGVIGDLTGQHATRLPLPPLSLSAIEELVKDSPRDAGQIFQVTGGNPFFVRELLAVSTGVVPETVRDAVLSRLMQLSPAARELAEVVSLLPGRTELWVTKEILGETGEAADEAVARGLLRYQDQALAFRHELGRLAVVDSIPRSRAQLLHERILRTLVEHQADLSRLVHHASLAQNVEALIEYAPRAAQQASLAGAHREAAAHLETAIRGAGSISAPERAHLYELHAVECNITNQVCASMDSATAALALWRELGDSAAQARVLLLLGRQDWKSGQNASAERNVSAAIALLESLPPGRDLAMAYSVRSQLAMTGHRTAEALEFGERAIDMAIRFGDDNVRSHALNNIGTSMAMSADVAGFSKLKESLEIALQQGLHEHAGRAYANLLSTSIHLRLSQGAAEYIAKGTEYCELHDVHDSLAYISALSTRFDLNAGQWDKAARAAADLLSRHSIATAQRIPTLYVLAMVRARRGDPGVDALSDEAAHLALATGELQRIGRIAAARAEIAWYRGDLEGVAREAAIGLQAAVGHREPWIRGEIAYWAHLADPGVKIPGELAEPFALMIDGDWQKAAAVWQRLGAPYEQALALADGPETALLESLAILERLGAGPLAAIVRQRLRERGVRSIPRGPRASTRSNPAGLTSREVQVLRLLVRGHTNNELAQRLHISAKTIDHHVSSILEKLEVRSRTEAVAAAIGLGVFKADA
jgi:DNA-binding CsgD family transcriptional regulator